MLMMTQYAWPAGLDTPHSRFVERSYWQRLFGFVLAGVCMGMVLHVNGAHPGNWALLGITVFAWPQLARVLVLRSRDAGTAEIRNRLIDSVLGGVWIALLQFNLLPCVLLTLMLTIDKANLGGWKLLGRGLLVQTAACVLTLAVHGFAFQPQTQMPEIVASLPLLVAYPLAVGMRLHSLARSAHEQQGWRAQMEQDAAASDLQEPVD